MKKNIFKKFIFLFVLIFILLGYNFVLAEEVPINIHLKINSGSNSLYNSDISVTACDSDNNPATPDNITAYCAIKQLEKLDKPIISDWTWYDFGVMINAINDITGYTSKDKDDKDVYHYWSWSLNKIEAMVGLNMYELKNGDIISLNFIPVQAEIINDAPPVEVKHHSSSSSSGSYITKPVIIEKVFNLENALKFLEINQKSDGSYSAPMYTDWVAVAIGAGDDKEIESKLINYLKENGVDSSIITDNERRAMALMSLGINPYSGTNVNYIKKITDSFDGTQFGDNTLVNDDIFALIVLKNAGYSINDELITKDLSYIISKQDKDGSWESIDMTAAGVQALKNFENIAGVNDAILKAEKYITTNQKMDGGFENSSSTSWVLQTLFADKEILKADIYLASKQDTDGGMESVGTDLNTRIWETAYAIPAILHKSWSIILNNFPKPDISTLILSKNEVIKQNRKVTSKISNINSGEVIKSTEDKKKIENIIDSNGEVKVNKPSNIWHVISAPFSWLLGKLGF